MSTADDPVMLTSPVTVRTDGSPSFPGPGLAAGTLPRSSDSREPVIVRLPFTSTARRTVPYRYPPRPFWMVSGPEVRSSKANSAFADDRSMVVPATVTRVALRKAEPHEYGLVGPFTRTDPNWESVAVTLSDPTPPLALSARATVTVSKVSTS